MPYAGSPMKLTTASASASASASKGGGKGTGTNKKPKKDPEKGTKMMSAFLRGYAESRNRRAAEGKTPTKVGRILDGALAGMGLGYTLGEESRKAKMNPKK